MRLYNPRSGREFATASDDELHVAVYLDAGWLPAPEPEPSTSPALAPEPVVYEPVTSKKRRGAKTEPAEGKETTD